MPSYAALIVTLILDCPLCLACVAHRAGLEMPTTRDCLDRIVGKVIDTEGECRSCRRVGPVVSIGRKVLGLD